MTEKNRAAIAVFIDFDNIQIGVRSTLSRDFDLAIVLDALRERGDVVTKFAYGDWHRAEADYSRAMSEHAVQMVQRTVTPRGDKNGADINLSLDALEMALTFQHIHGIAIVGGDSDFIALVEKLKQYGKQVYVVGGRNFTSNILQRNCHEFIAYERLLQQQERAQRSRRGGRGSVNGPSADVTEALPIVRRGLEMLEDRETTPHLGPLKSALLQLDPTFSEKDYGSGSFRQLMQSMAKAGLVKLTRDERGYTVELLDEDSDGRGDDAADDARQADDSGQAKDAGSKDAEPASSRRKESPPASAEKPKKQDKREQQDKQDTQDKPQETAGGEVEPRAPEDVLPLVRNALGKLGEESGYRSFYLRRIGGAMRALDASFDHRAYGFRTLTDLLMFAQREGLVRMQRDRSGAWLVWNVETDEAEAAAQQDTDDTGRDSAETPTGDPAVAAATDKADDAGTAAADDGEAVDKPAADEGAETAEAGKTTRKKATGKAAKKTTKKATKKTAKKTTKKATKKATKKTAKKTTKKATKKATKKTTKKKADAAS